MYSIKRFKELVKECLEDIQAFECTMETFNDFQREVDESCDFLLDYLEEIHKSLHPSKAKMEKLRSLIIPVNNCIGGYVPRTEKGNEVHFQNLRRKLENGSLLKVTHELKDDFIHGNQEYWFYYEDANHADWFYGK